MRELLRKSEGDIPFLFQVYLDAEIKRSKNECLVDYDDFWIYYSMYIFKNAGSFTTNKKKHDGVKVWLRNFS